MCNVHCAPRYFRRPTLHCETTLQFELCKRSPLQCAMWIVHLDTLGDQPRIVRPPCNVNCARDCLSLQCAMCTVHLNTLEDHHCIVRPPCNLIVHCGAPLHFQESTFKKHNKIFKLSVFKVALVIVWQVSYIQNQKAQSLYLSLSGETHVHTTT